MAQHGTRVDAATIERSTASLSPTESVLEAAAVPAVAVEDLERVVSMDVDPDRVGIVSGASVTQSCGTSLLAARREGFAAVRAVIPLGRPVTALTRLTHKPVEEFAMLERRGGAPLGPPGG